MTDQDLIDKLQQEPPGEWTASELEHLRTRLQSSSVLRQAVHEQLHLEEQLHRVLGKIHISADSIVTRAAVLQSQSNRRAAFWGWTLCGGMTLAVLVLILVGRNPRPNAENPLADKTLPAAGDREGQSQVDGSSAETATAALPGSQPVTPQTEIARADNGAASGDVRAKPPADPPAGVAARAVEPTVAPPTLTPDQMFRRDWPELAGEPLTDEESRQALFDDEGSQQRGLRQADLTRWLGPVAGQEHRFFEAVRHEVATSGFEHLVQLKAPWRDEAVLRFSAFDHQGLGIYFWNGDDGVALRFVTQPRPAWAAYSVTRTDRKPRPSKYRFLGTDADRYERTGKGTVEVRYQQGMLVLSRGDLRLLTSPLSGPPVEVYFDRRGWFRSFGMYRGRPLPEDAVPPGLDLLASDVPAAQAWSGAALDALTKLPDGAVVLEREKGREDVRVTFAVPRPGLSDVVFRIDEATPGTGVYLANDQGQPLYQLGVFREGHTQGLAFNYLRVGERTTDHSVDVEHQPAPLFGPGQWIRLVTGCGVLRCWTSGDGVHWQRALDPLRGMRGAWSQVGVYCLKGDQDRRIKLGRVQVRELPEWSSLAAPLLCEQVPETVLQPDLEPGVWLRRTIETQPADVPSREWRAACGVKTLAQGPPTYFANWLLIGLLQDALASPASPRQRLKWLHAAAELHDSWEWHDGLKMVGLYQSLADQPWDDGVELPSVAVSRALRAAPIWTTAQYPATLEALARRDVLQLVEAQRWPAVHALCMQIRFWNQSSNPDARWPDQLLALRGVVEWADGFALRQRPELASRSGLAHVLPANWRHPLIVEVGKEAFNTLAEVQVALSEESLGDACRVISNAKPDQALGLLPDSRDPQLLVSLPQAVSAAMSDHPGLQQAMIAQFSKLGHLRVQQGVAEGHVLGVKAATVQFFGTEAAAEAHLWLGDRYLASGDFVRSLAEYERALPTAPVPLRAQLVSKLRLAGAMLGRDVGSPPTEPVKWESAQWAPQAFEDMVSSLRQRAAQTETLELQPHEAVPKSGALAPAQFTTHMKGRYEGDVGHAAGSAPGRDVDWVAGQVSWLSSDDVLYVHNRFHLTAYDVQTLKVKWNQGLGGEQGQAHDWRLTTMRPVVAGKRLFVRRLTKHGPNLACIDTENGRVLWSARPGDHVASDPWLVQDEVLAFTIQGSQDGTLQVWLTAFQPHNGDVVWQSPLLQLRDVWHRQVPCTASRIGNCLVANIGGNVVCCTLEGQPLWVRRQTWLPAQNEFGFLEHARAAPQAVGNRLYVAQPGAFTLTCLDLHSGRQLWERCLPDLRRVLAVDETRVLVEDAGGLQSLDAHTGAIVWRTRFERLLNAAWVSKETGVLCTRREWVRDDVHRPCLVWLDAETGRENAVWPLDNLEDKAPCLGPLMVAGERVFTLFGRGPGDAQRELVELVRTTDPPLGGQGDSGLDHWTPPQLDRRLVQGAGYVLPGWCCLVSSADKRTGWAHEAGGRKEVCTTLPGTGRATVFAREVQVPADGRPRLIVETGAEGAGRWRFELLAGRQSLLAEEVPGGSTQEWREWEVDLSRFAGRTIWLNAQHTPEAQPGYSLWRRLELRN